MKYYLVSTFRFSPRHFVTIISYQARVFYNTAHTKSIKRNQEMYLDSQQLTHTHISNIIRNPNTHFELLGYQSNSMTYETLGLQ